MKIARRHSAKVDCEREPESQEMRAWRMWSSGQVTPRFFSKFYLAGRLVDSNNLQVSKSHNEYYTRKAWLELFSRCCCTPRGLVN